MESASVAGGNRVQGAVCPPLSERFVREDVEGTGLTPQCGENKK